MRILVADDDAQTRQLVTRVLKEDGHEVRAVNSCAGVDASVPAGAFEVVVLDVMLPDGSGIALCSRDGVREFRGSARAPAERAERARSAGSRGASPG